MSNNPKADPLIGKTVSQYEIVAKLGGGGMGVVYRAKDIKLGRAVALKFLPPQWSHDETAKQRFMREAQAASATNHQNICVIHNIEETDDGQLFIVMAHYEGQTLKQKLEGGAVPIEEALEIASGIAEGLAKAHAQGVVHRDIKPGNLMITDDGVKILDFGLAKFADALQLTVQGSTIGTVAYMSPEQAKGEEADARSDVWALGVVLYEMLTAEAPFKGTYPEATFYAIKNEPLPSLRAPGRDIPEAVERLVVRALKDPNARFQTARELARDLRLLQGRSVPIDFRSELLPPLQAPPPEAWWQRAWNGLTLTHAVIAALGLLAAGTAVYLWLDRPVERIPVAIAPVANHTGEPGLGAYRLALTETLVAELTESPNIRVVPYFRLVEIARRFLNGAEAEDFASREAVQAIATLSGARVIVVPALAYRGDKWLAQAEFRNAETGTNISTFETEALASSLPKETAARLIVSLADGIQAYFKTNGPGRWYARRPAGSRFRSVEAARAFEQGLNDYEQLEYAAALTALTAAAGEDGQHAMTHAWLSRVLLILNRGNDAVEAGRRAKQLVASDTPRGEVPFIEATLAESQADFALAEKHYRQLGKLQPDAALPQVELADFLKRQNRNQEAVEAYRAVLRLDAGYIRPHVELCQLYTRINEHTLAEQEAQSALEKYRAAGNRAGEAQALLCLGDSQRKEGKRLADARRNVESARDVFESLKEPYGLSRAYNYLGLVAAAERNYPAAARFFEEALDRSRQIGNRQIEGLALMNLGVAYEALGQRTQVLKYYQQGADFYRQSGDERRAAEQEANTANLLVHYGSNPDEARRLVVNARATFKKLGSIDFEVFAMQVEALGQLYGGHHVEARRQLHEALSLAKERQLRDNIVSLTVDIAESHLLSDEYEMARAQLEPLATPGAGRDLDAQTQIALGRVYVRLAEFDAAKGFLEGALAGIGTSGQVWLAALARESLGELAYESGNTLDAREHFGKAAALWTDDFPDAASVEARCYQGLLDAGKGPAARRAVEAGVERARKMGRLSLEARCRVQLARLNLRERRSADAVAVLRGIAPDGAASIGPALRAQAHYWRGRALADGGDRAGAETETTQAQTLLRELQASLPLQYRPRFAQRPDIRQVLEQQTVRKPR